MHITLLKQSYSVCLRCYREAVRASPNLNKWSYIDRKRAESNGWLIMHCSLEFDFDCTKNFLQAVKWITFKIIVPTGVWNWFNLQPLELALLLFHILWCTDLLDRNNWRQKTQIERGEAINGLCQDILYIARQDGLSDSLKSYWLIDRALTSIRL